MPADGGLNLAKAHLAMEQQVLEHVRRLLNDGRLRLDTRQGQRPITQFRLHLVEGDSVGELRQHLSEAGITDGTVEHSYPKRATLDVALLRRKWFVLAEVSGRLHLRVLAPLAALVSGDVPRPATLAEVQRAIDQATDPRCPTTIVLVSTSGFAVEARELAERKPGRTVLLLEPNGAGGWRTHGPTEIRSVVDLLDPENEDDKRRRVRDYVLAREVDLGGSGLSADKVASVIMLPVQLVEAEMKTLAKERPGWAARRLDGRLVLYRQGAALQPATTQEPAMLDRIRGLFGRKGDTEKKIAYLSERRAALGQQRDRLYEQLAKLEAQETALKHEYRQAGGPLAKRRITSQLLKLRKDAERRQQLLGMLNQQIQVVGVHLHNLELARTGTAHGLPPAEEIAEDAARAEQVLAEVQASAELAVSGGVAVGGLTEEETALMQELDAELTADVRQPAAGDALAMPQNAAIPRNVPGTTAQPTPMRLVRPEPDLPDSPQIPPRPD